MGRVFVPQYGRCEWCGARIWRTRPTQRWMDEKKASMVCDQAPEGQWQNHKPKPWE